MRLYALLALLLAPSLAAAADTEVLSAKEVYDGACASCHGSDGRGSTDTAAKVPLPDFSDCRFVTAENDGNWRYLIAHGGDSLGLSTQMPGFAGVLSADQIDAVLNYVRAFCPDTRWPHGDLNFRRVLITGKAFPEDEVLLKPEFTNGRNGESDWSAEFSFERRIGARGQVEVSLPLVIHDVRDGATTGGIGDVTLAYTHVLLASREWSTIVSAGLDLGLPSGDYHRGLGEGTVSFAPSLLAGKRLGPLVVQGQIRGELPVDENRADRGVRYRFAFSYPLAEIKRAWVPSIELETVQNVTAQQNNLFVTPQIYRGLSQRGHIAVAAGAQIPVAGDADPFDVRILGFFLWEYADGGLWW